MSAFREKDSSGKITILPKDAHSATIILMHGLGDSSDGFADVAQMWSSAMPHVKVILPTASSRPVTLNGGMRMPAWYDIVGLDERSGELCEGIEESVSTIREIINNEIQSGLPASRIILSGFSQGGALSLFTGLQMPPELKPAGIVVMSGYLAGAGKFKLTPGFEDVPVLHCHGTGDMVVRYDWAGKTKSAIESNVSYCKVFFLINIILYNMCFLSRRVC